MSDLIPFIFFAIIMLMLVRSSRRRQRRSRPKMKWESPDSLEGLPLPPSPTLSDLDDAAPSEALHRQATTTQIAEALTTALRSSEKPPARPAPLTASQRSPVTASSVSDRNPDLVAIGEGVPKTPDAPVQEIPDDESRSPVFAAIDPAVMDPTIAAAMADNNALRAARSLRNASLNGTEGSDLALGMHYWEMGRADEAEGILRNIARTDPQAANNLAAILETRGHLREAMPFYRRAAQTGDNTARENLQRLEG